MRNCIINIHAIFNTNFGEELYLVGNHQELGDWDPLRGLKLVTEKQTYPKWKALRRIRVGQGVDLEFKICICEGNRFKRWENFPVGLNRKFKTDCRTITLLIIENTQSLVEEKRFDNYSSKQLFPMQVRKYTSVVEDELSSEESSSSSGYGDYYEKQEVVPQIHKCQHNIKSLISTIRYILSEGWVKFQNMANNSDQQRQVDMQNLKVSRKTAKYFANCSAGTFLEKHQNIIQEINVEMGDSFQKWQKGSLDVVKLFKQRIKHNQNFTQEAFVFQGTQFSLLPRLLKKHLSEFTQKKILLHFGSFQFNEPVLNEQPALVIESILMSDCLMFHDYSAFDNFLFYLEREGLQISIKCESLHNEYILLVNQKIVIAKIVDVTTYQQNISMYVLNNNKILGDAQLEKIVQRYEKCKNKRVMIFNFGRYENFQLLLKNKDLLTKLSKQNLIYVFTPNKIKQFTEILQIFPEIVFIGFHHMEIAYRRQIFTLFQNPQTQIHLNDLIEEIQEELSIYPCYKLTVEKNVILIKQQTNNRLALAHFADIYTRIQESIDSFNEITKQNLLISKINSTTIEIRQYYQTQIFFSNLIFKNSETPVQFLGLFSIDRFHKLNYHEDLKRLVEEKRSHFLSNTQLYSFAIQKDKCSLLQEPSVLCENQFSKLISLMFKTHSEAYIMKQKLLNMRLIERVKALK